MKKLLQVILLSSVITSCGGGGGGGGGGGSGVSGSATPTYSYSKMLDRLENNTISSFNEVGRSLIYTYHEESNSNWYSTRRTDFNLAFSQGTDTYGDPFFKVSYDQDVEDIPADYTTSLDYRRNYEINITQNDISQLYDAPNFSSAFKYYSNASLRIYGTWDPVVYPGTEYVDMIMWHMDYDNSSYDDFIAFAYGEKTFSGDMPVNGSSTYNVATIGFWNYNYNVYNFKGDGFLIANFGTMKIDGELTLDYVTDNIFGWTQLIGADAGLIELEGDISGSSFTGTVDWYTSDETPDGSFEGNFFGPDAKEVGGTFYAAEPENGYKNNIIGTFIGVR